ncbi:MAG: diguanylate cyclase [Oscillospiraceae bacterium]|nr:diguanylate cyclase [Oscillospiraceae bacterium]
MEKIWEFYENLDEYVYVADIDSYELVYMNRKAREAFNVQSAKCFMGKKCYEVLQQCSTPCTFCTNVELKPGCFKRWRYYNSVLDKHLILFDSMVIADGRRYRIEVAVNVNNEEEREKALGRYQNLEMLVNNALGVALQKPTPDETIQTLLEHIGHILRGERAYIFEKNEHGNDDNTYEWVAAGITPQKQNLQNVPPWICEPWYLQFQKHSHVLIRDLEDIQEQEPMMYQVLKPQGIHSLVVVPLEFDGEITAFYGVDNPPAGTLEDAIGILRIMGHFITASLKRRDLMRKLLDLSFRDQQTQLGNRYALQRFVDEEYCVEMSLGVMFCDVTGLKRVNDEQGHKAGDVMIARAAESLREIYDGYQCFRFGGDELLALCPGISEKETGDKGELLKLAAKEKGIVLSVGTAWAAAGAANIDSLLSEAETRMYQDKSRYYQTMGIDRRKH